MALSLNEYVATASQTDFVIGWGYLADADVIVEVDGVVKTLTTDYTLPSASIIRFGSGLSVGDAVLIYRSTNQSARLVDYTAPSTLDEDDLDNDSLQAFYMAQEALDAAGRKLDLHSAGEDISGFNGFYLTINASGIPAPGVSLSTLSLDYTSQRFSGDNSTVAFTLSKAPADVTVTEVFISGVRQVPVIDYTVSDVTLTFDAAPPNGTNNIYVRHGSSAAVVVADGSITAAKLASSSVTAVKLNTDAVTTVKINAAAITEAKIGTDAVNWLTKIKAATAGDLPVFDNSGNPALLAKGNALKLLRMNSGATALEYSTPPAIALGTKFTSDEQSLTAAGALTIAHGLTVSNAYDIFVRAVLICQTADLNYSENDVVQIPVSAMHDSSASNTGVSVVADVTNLNIRFGSAAIVFVLTDKTTGASSGMLAASWKIRFIAYV